MAKGHLLIAAIPPMHGHAKEEEADTGSEDMGEEDGGERDAFDGFADAAGIPEDKRDDAYSALKDMMHICFSNYEKEPHEEYSEVK